MIVLTEAGSLTPSSTACSLSALKRSSCSAFLYDLYTFNRLIMFSLITFFILHSQKVAFHSKSEGIVAQEVGHHSNHTRTWHCRKTLCSKSVSLIWSSTFAVRNRIKGWTYQSNVICRTAVLNYKENNYIVGSVILKQLGEPFVQPNNAPPFACH